MPWIYHLCPAADWAAAQAAGAYRGSAAALADGFLHASTAAQIAESARRHQAGRPDLVLLAIDAAQVEAILRWEPSRGGALFPHLYGPVPLAAIRQATALPLGHDGLHRFPGLEP